MDTLQWWTSALSSEIYIKQREKGVVILLPKIVLRNKLIVTIPIRNKFSFIFMPYVSTVLDCLLQWLTAAFEKNWWVLNNHNFVNLHFHLYFQSF